MDLPLVHDENCDFLDIFLLCVIFLRHSGKTVKLRDWHQGNAVLKPFFFQYYSKFFVALAKPAQLGHSFLLQKSLFSL